MVYKADRVTTYISQWNQIKILKDEHIFILKIRLLESGWLDMKIC